jgi:hypothetical protein
MSEPQIGETATAQLRVAESDLANGLRLGAGKVGRGMHKPAIITSARLAAGAAKRA